MKLTKEQRELVESNVFSYGDIGVVMCRVLEKDEYRTEAAREYMFGVMKEIASAATNKKQMAKLKAAVRKANKDANI